MATLSVTFDEKKLARLQKKLGPGIVLPPVGRLIKDMADLVQEEATNRAPDVLARIFDPVNVTPLQAVIRVVHPGARAMEAGRKPLVAGGKMPPPDALRGIARPGTEFALARSIAQRGVKGRFFFQKARIKANRELPRLASKAAAEIAGLWFRD